ncbi:MAG TPA: phosphate ABC transporter permease PstA [Candidatus Binataceae bacterium]|nr:phosphate ABC transporter permease PstA [Candidatus Binataceae bacterium]
MASGEIRPPGREVRAQSVDDIDLPSLERSLRQPRALFSYTMSTLAGAATILALFPLVSVLYLLVKRGVAALHLSSLSDLPPAAMALGGGFGNALVGTFVIVAIATVLSVPIGIIAAIYITEFGPETRTAAAVRFAAKVLTGLPSILAGVFAFAVVVLATGGFSAPAGGVALALLMLPTILLTAEQAIKRVPSKMREAAVGMGASPTQVVTWVILPTASPGILTGVMLAVARAAGETAPLLFTALFSEYWMSRTFPHFLPKTLGDLMQPTASLAVMIYNFSGSPFENQIGLAWTAALTLVVLILIFNILGQYLAGRSSD